jgi:broad specificity phosphatase PhoE
MINRTHKYVQEINTKFKTKTIITVSHGDPIVGLQKYFKSFDWCTQKNDFYIQNSEFRINYFDNTTQKEIDLHRPHVDNYRFNIDDKIYHRIPEVMDCWFESGSMPFGQVGFIKKKD